MAGETLDRIVATVGEVSLTQSDVETEYRFELFLRAEPPAGVLDAKTFEQVLQRLIEQTLLAQEAEAANLGREDASRQAAEPLGQVKKKYPSPEAFASALRALGMDESQVLKRLTDHALALQLIDQRLRPAAWVEGSEIEAYYHKTFVTEYARQNKGAVPDLEKVEEQIREILTQQKIDQLLSGWLDELKAGQRVRLRSF